MCGRYSLPAATQELAAQFDVDDDQFPSWLPRYSVAPTNTVPIVREHQDAGTAEIKREISAAVWNFRPPFAGEPKRPQINARIENLTKLGFWKGAFASTRCIVPMRGYFEFTGEKSPKQPHFIHAGEQLLAAAGLTTSRHYQDADGNDVHERSVAIITRAARDASGEIHDRMPAFLTPDVFPDWLSVDDLHEGAEQTAMLQLLHDVSDTIAGTLTTYEVDPKMNNARAIDATDSSIIQPLRR